jgi:TRAP-type mannitol/chloroaromatic compound transport system substrate-binding protein
MSRTIKKAKQQKVRDVYGRLMAKNPKFKEVMSTDKGFVIVGVKLPPRR